jgi:AbrB family looped-hinge helix DNA binding protein
MNAIIYGRGQMTIPAKARKDARLQRGDVVSVQPDGDGRILLVRLDPVKPPAAKVRFMRKNGRTVANTGRSITGQQVKALLNEVA